MQNEVTFLLDWQPTQIRSNALIKRGSLKMQLGQQEEALADFNSAVMQDSENSDIYHHRGQVGRNSFIQCWFIIRYCFRNLQLLLFGIKQGVYGTLLIGCVAQ